MSNILTHQSSAQADDAKKTHTLKAIYKAGNGKRQSHDFPLTAKQATEPSLRARAVDGAGFYGDGRGWRLVNWEITEGAPRFDRSAWIEPIGKRFRYATVGVLFPGTKSHTLKSWASKKSAAIAALRDGYTVLPGECPLPAPTVEQIEQYHAHGRERRAALAQKVKLVRTRVEAKGFEDAVKAQTARTLFETHPGNPEVYSSSIRYYPAENNVEHGYFVFIGLKDGVGWLTQDEAATVTA